MAASKLVSVVGLEPLIAKVDAGLQIQPTLARLLPDITQLGARTLVERMPADWVRPRQVTIATSAAGGSISIPRYPYVFFERGSQYPRRPGAPKRQHRTRGSFVKTPLRIKPRRFIARTRAILRREIPNMVLQLQDAVEKDWAS